MNATGYYYVIDITAQVNRWLAGADQNDGLLLRPSSGSSLLAAFDAKENTSTSHAAYLNVQEAGLQGPQGPTGPAGPAGPEGPMGPAGLPGTNGFEYVGSYSGRPSSPHVNDTALFTGATSTGACGTTGGSAYAICSWNGSAWVPSAGGGVPGGTSGQVQINNGGAFAGITLPVSGLLKGAAGPSFAQAAAGTDYAPATVGTSLLKGNGAGGFSSAAAGTDYAPATSGTAILKGNAIGGFSNAVAGTDYAAANASTIINGSVCGLGSSCTISTASAARILYNPSGGTAAKCQGGMAGMAFSFAATGAPIAGCETDGIQAYVDFTAATPQTVYDRFVLPFDWSSTMAITVSAYSASTSAPAISVALSCITNTATVNPVFGVGQSISLTPNASSGLTTIKTRLQTSAVYTNKACAAGDFVEWKLTVTAAGAADLKLLSLLFTE